MDPVEGVIFGLSVLGMLGSTAFLVIYHRVARWWESGYGRGMFALMVMTLLAFTSTVLFEFLGTGYPGYTLLRVSRLAVGVLGVLFLLYTLVIEGTRRHRRLQDEQNRHRIAE